MGRKNVLAVKPISVSQVNSYIRRVLQSDPLLGNVTVTGEVSNLTYHGSGHVYFTLKDAASSLNCFLPRDVMEQQRYEIAEGMEIIINGYIAVYEKGGRYSLNVRSIEVEGMGNLAIAFEKLREKLEKEGLFDPKYKKPLPKFPKKLVIVTSETGAAVRDMLKIIKGRTSLTDVLIYPCLVQGPDAAPDIARAIQEVNRLFPDTDVMIVGRGGGSMEDLWAFNEEVVARSIFLSEIPVISAVGHERDFTIADFAADKRAATPTEAAQLAVPDMTAVWQQTQAVRRDLRNSFDRILRYMELRTKAHDLPSLRRALLDRMDVMDSRAERFRNQIRLELERKVLEFEGRTERAKAAVEAADPRKILDRGYAMVLSKGEKPTTSAGAFSPGENLTVVLKDGKVICSVNEVRMEKNG
ncbi:MAG: exodeoxyribonuclease VII large subunit [Firmicutes bacterium]|nr:exodeoxyribonuclease VII large subunit [Bacillota bacterium]